LFARADGYTDAVMSAQFKALDEAEREAFTSAYFRGAGLVSDGWAAERRGLILGQLYEGQREFWLEDDGEARAGV
jgi:hypothetical protein